MKHFGLIGHPLGHSFSKTYFNEKFRQEGLDCEYQNYDIPSLGETSTPGTSLPPVRSVSPSGLRAIAKQSKLCGFNVTIPYKEAIIPYLDELDPAAKEIGAVNTVKVLPDGSLKGYNTDVIGFESSWIATLRKAPLAMTTTARQASTDETAIPNSTLPTPHSSLLTPHSALILGTGGASKAVQYVLKKHGIPFHLVSRDEQKGDFIYDQLTPEIVKDHLLIINTTPVGMAPYIDAAPDIPYNAITPNHTLIDLIYNPEETLFLKHGREHGATIQNGLTMLHAQAEASWKIWNE